MKKKQINIGVKAQCFASGKSNIINFTTSAAKVETKKELSEKNWDVKFHEGFTGSGGMVVYIADVMTGYLQMSSTVRGTLSKAEEEYKRLAKRLKKEKMSLYDIIGSGLSEVADKKDRGDSFEEGLGYFALLYIVHTQTYAGIKEADGSELDDYSFFVTSYWDYGANSRVLRPSAAKLKSMSTSEVSALINQGIEYDFMRHPNRFKAGEKQIFTPKVI